MECIKAYNAPNGRGRACALANLDKAGEAQGVYFYTAKFNAISKKMYSTDFIGLNLDQESAVKDSLEKDPEFKEDWMRIMKIHQAVEKPCEIAGYENCNQEKKCSDKYLD